MDLKFVAVVSCDHESKTHGCTETGQYVADPEALTLEQFGMLATGAFRQTGWRCNEPYPRDQTFCPHHNPDNHAKTRS